MMVMMTLNYAITGSFFYTVLVVDAYILSWMYYEGDEIMDDWLKILVSYSLVYINF